MSQQGPSTDSERQSLSSRFHGYIHDFEGYFSTTVWIPSVALAMLHYNMMTWRATFITYLINTGYSLNAITIARAIGSVFEICSTVITPIGIHYMGHTKSGKRRTSGGDDEDEDEALIHSEDGADARTTTGLERFGLWGVTWQLLFLVSPPRDWP